MTDIARIALETLATADALRSTVQQIDRLDRAKHPGVTGSEEATIVHCNAPIVAQALETIAQRLGQPEE